MTAARSGRIPFGAGRTCLVPVLAIQALLPRPYFRTNRKGRRAASRNQWRFSFAPPAQSSSVGEKESLNR